MAQHNKFAVVTGASSGIGYELARVFAENGYDLLVTSGSQKIETAAPDFSGLGVEVKTVEADLSTYDGVEKLWAEIQSTGRPVDAIAINAGIGAYGDFARESDLDEELKLIQLNVTSTVHLAKRVLKEMTARGSGKVLITSSIAGTMPAPRWPFMVRQRPLVCHSGRRSGTNSRIRASQSRYCSRARPTPISSIALE